MNTTQIEFWVGITCTVILPLSAFILFLIMDKLNDLKTRIQNIFDTSNAKDARINELNAELESARARIAELETVVANSSVTQSSLDEVSTFLAERGF